MTNKKKSSTSGLSCKAELRSCQKFKHFSYFFLIVLLVLACEDKKKDFLKSKAIAALNKKTYRLKPAKETPNIYQWYCAPCHGLTGEGNGINSPEMPARPINHTDSALMSMKSDHDLFQAISKGGLAIGRAPCMPPWEYTLDKKTIASLVGYLRGLCKCEHLL